MVIASYNLSQTNRVPYVTQTEVLNSAIANNVDFSNLIEDGDENQQEAALQEMIVRASTKVDTTCFGYAGTLCATVSYENGRYLANRLGQFIIHPEYWPILEVRAFSNGWGPGTNMSAVPLSDQNCSIERNQFIVTSQSAQTAVVGVSLNSVLPGGFGTYPQFCEWTYVNGFANTFLAADAAADATSIQVTPAPGSTSPVGIYPGMPLTIWDAQYDEGVIVAANYDGASTTVPLATALLYPHDAGVNVSAIPATIKSAVIHFIVDECFSRGQIGVSLGAMGGVEADGKNVDTQNHEAKAYDLLDEFQQYWGRS